MDIGRLKSVQWECIHFCRRAPVDEKKEISGIDEFYCTQIDCQNIFTEGVLLQAIADSLKFPEYFGGNFDSLDECLKDLTSWLPAKGYILILQNSSSVWRLMPLTIGRVVQSWLSCAEEWSKSDTSFHLVFADLD